MTVNESITAAKIAALAGMAIVGITATLMGTSKNSVQETQYAPQQYYAANQYMNDYMTRPAGYQPREFSYYCNQTPYQPYGYQAPYMSYQNPYMPQYVQHPVYTQPQQMNPMAYSRRNYPSYQMTPQNVYQMHQPQYQMPTQQFQAPMAQQQYYQSNGYQPIQNNYTELSWNDITCTQPQYGNQVNYGYQQNYQQPMNYQYNSSPYAYPYEAQPTYQPQYPSVNPGYDTQSYGYKNGGGVYPRTFPSTGSCTSHYRNAPISTRNKTITNELRWETPKIYQYASNNSNNSEQHPERGGIVPCFVTPDGVPLFSK